MNPPLIVEIFATACGLAGALLLATKRQLAGWGFVAFLVSNLGWMAFSFAHGHWALFVQHLCFAATSALGIWVWLVEPAIDRRYQRLSIEAVKP